MNMVSRSGYQVYQRNKYETASPHKLILLLYDGALLNIARAQQSYERGMNNEAKQSILKAQDIVSELLSCLNEDQGGELASRMMQLYLYVMRMLVDANIHRKKEALYEAEVVLRDLRSAWEQIGKDVGLSAT